MSLRGEEGGLLLLSIGCWWWTGVEEVGGHGTAVLLDALETALRVRGSLCGKDSSNNICRWLH